MSDQILKLATDLANTGKQLDLEELLVGANTVQRERHQIAGASALEIASVKNAEPTSVMYGLLIRMIWSAVSVFRYLGLDTTGRVAKASAGRVKGITAFNVGNAMAYLKVYDKATAPTSADTPVYTYPLPPTGIPFSPGYSPDGVPFAAGISCRASTGILDNDNTAPGANEVVVNLEYV